MFIKTQTLEIGTQAKRLHLDNLTYYCVLNTIIICQNIIINNTISKCQNYESKIVYYYISIQIFNMVILFMSFGMNQTLRMNHRD